MVDHPALAMARLQGSNIKAVRNQGWLNACGVALGVLGAPLDAVAFVDCNYLIETCTEMYGIMRNVCKGIEIYTLNIHFYTHTHTHGDCMYHIIFQVPHRPWASHSRYTVAPQSLLAPVGMVWVVQMLGCFKSVLTYQKYNLYQDNIEKCVYYILHSWYFIHTYTYLCMH